VEQDAPIGFDRELSIAVRDHVGARLEPEVRRIGVGADDSKAAFRRRGGADLDRDQAPVGARRKAAVARPQLPGRSFGRFSKVGGGESPRGLRDRVIWRRRDVDVIEKIPDGVVHGAQHSDAERCSRLRIRYGAAVAQIARFRTPGSRGGRVRAGVNFEAKSDSLPGSRG
jgi:hypothetical protein